MSSQLQQIGAITIFVADLPRSRAFYQDVFSSPVIYQDENSCVFDFSGTMINLLESAEAIGLVEPETVADRSAGSRFMLSIWVDDVDSCCLELSARGVDLLNGPIDREWGKRTASFTDPDGNIWEIAQDIPSPGAGVAGG
jgi:catechol 2,3-dioxygenase-like lactoylglutathione lyase family enzyme